MGGVAWSAGCDSSTAMLAEWGPLCLFAPQRADNQVGVVSVARDIDFREGIFCSLPDREVCFDAAQSGGDG